MRKILSIVSTLAALASSVGALAQNPSPTGAATPSATPPGALPWGSIAVVVDEACCARQRSLPLAQSDDVATLERLRDRAYRNGLVLQLQLDGERSLKIVDSTNVGESCDGYDGCRRHLLHAWWPKHRYYVVDVRLWEGGQAFLVAARDGHSVLVAAPPVLSPSGRFAIAADLSPAYGNGLQLIDMQSNPPTVLDVKSEPACPGAAQSRFIRPTPVWLDESRVTFTGKSQSDTDDPTAKQVLRIVDGKPEWEC